MDAIKRKKAFLAYAARLHELANAIEVDEKEAVPVAYTDAEFMPVVVRMTVMAKDASTDCLNAMGFKKEEVIKEFADCEIEQRAKRVLILLKQALEQRLQNGKKDS